MKTRRKARKARKKSRLSLYRTWPTVRIATELAHILAKAALLSTALKERSAAEWQAELKLSKAAKAKKDRRDASGVWDPRFCATCASNVSCPLHPSSRQGGAEHG